MRFLTPFKIAYKALTLHKLRTWLTVLGLVIGITSIMVVMNMGQGIKDFVLKQIEVFGTDYVEIEIKVPSAAKTSSENAMGLAQGITITTLKTKDALAIGKYPNVRAYYYGLLSQNRINYQERNKTINLWGISPSFFGLYKAKVKQGRPFGSAENKEQAKVIILGLALKQKLFDDAPAVGKWVKLANKKFKVIGVMEKQGSAFFMDMDNLAYVPVRTLQKQILGVNHIQFIIAYLKDVSQAQATAADLTQIMRRQHNITQPKKDDFAVTTMEEAMSMLNTITGGISLLLLAIAVISLLVGGVGIMNIIYVSVSERTYEIGLRKSLGAKKSNILEQFLWEAVLLTFSGGLIGVILGSLFSLLGALAATHFGFDWGFHFSWLGMLLALGFSVLVGLIFGIYPARKAANMDPVSALRS